MLTARIYEGFPQGRLSLSDPQRTWASISLQDVVKVQLYDPFVEGEYAYLGSVDAEVGFAGRKSTEAPFDQDELAQLFTKVDWLLKPFKIFTHLLRTTKTSFLRPTNGFSWTTRAYL